MFLKSDSSGATLFLSITSQEEHIHVEIVESCSTYVCIKYNYNYTCMHSRRYMYMFSMHISTTCIVSRLHVPPT